MTKVDNNLIYCLSFADTVVIVDGVKKTKPKPGRQIAKNELTNGDIIFEAAHKYSYCSDISGEKIWKLYE